MPIPSNDDDDSLGKKISLHNSSSELDSVTSKSSSDVNSLSSTDDHSSDSGDEDDLIRPVYHDDEHLIMKKVLDHERPDCCSVDTESLTNEPSLISSFSSDTQGSDSPSQSVPDLGQARWEVIHSLQDTIENQQYDTNNVIYRAPAFPQLRHRRDYSTTIIADETDYVSGETVDVQCDNGLSPTAKHKPTTLGRDNSSSKGSHSQLKPSVLSLFVQFTIMTYIVFYVLTLTHDGELVDPRWVMPSARSARRLIKKIESLSQPTSSSRAIGPLDGFTVRLRGERVDLLHRSIERISRCNGVRSIQIDYNPTSAIFDAFGRLDFPEELLSHPSGKVVQMQSSYITSKQHGSTDGVLLLDEDSSLSCVDLEHAFSEWKLDPVRAVGFFGYHDYTHSTSLLSDKALFVHRLYLSPRNTSIMKIPAEKSNCRHLALSAFVSSISSRNPYLVSRTSVATTRQATRSVGTSSESISEECVSSILHLAGSRSAALPNMSYIGQPSLRRR